MLVIKYEQIKKKTDMNFVITKITQLQGNFLNSPESIMKPHYKAN
ncbi:hypothetical protein NYR90_18180 [Clostridioides difficile]|nr:hypothetical protein NYR90_18180 [Clostridioides difficile]